MTRVVILCALFAGCAPMSESECRGSNWYARGEQDALTGSQPRRTTWRAGAPATRSGTTAYRAEGCS